MKKLLSASAAIALATLGLSAAPASAVTPAADVNYSMANTLSDSVGASTLTPAPICSSPATEDLCNVSAEFGSNEHGNFWHWTTTQGNGGGAALVTDAPLGATYTVSIKFSLDELSNEEDPDKYSKILDFKNLTEDAGIYGNGEASPYTIMSDLAGGDTEVALGEVVEMTIVRDASASPATFTMYLKNASGLVVAFDAEDTGPLYIAADSDGGSILRLFQEEPESAGDSHEGVKEGHLYGIQAWPGVALTQEQVDGITFAGGLAETGADAGQVSAIAGFGIAALVAGAAVIARRRRA